jgi:uncharacterized protein
MKTKFFIIIIFNFTVLSSFSQELKTYKRKDETKESEGILVDQKENGVWKYWDKDGRLLREIEYFDGMINGRVTYFYPSGKKENEGFFSGGFQIGKYCEWSKEGVLLLTGKYVRGKKDSVWNEFRENGKPKSIFNYKNDFGKIVYYFSETGDTIVKQGNGKFEEKFANGKISETGFYHNGLKILFGLLFTATSNFFQKELTKTVKKSENGSVFSTTENLKVN